MLLMSAAEDAELEKWRMDFGRCRLSDNAPPAKNLEDVLEDIPTLMAIFTRLRLQAGGHVGTLAFTGDEVSEIEKSSGLTRTQIAAKTLEIAATLSVVSDPRDNVVSVVETIRGGIYLGAPITWKGAGVKFSVHGIQSAILNAWYHGDTQIKSVMSETRPCACCRQFLREAWTSNNIKISIMPRGHSQTQAKDPEIIPLAPEGVRLGGIKGRLLGETRRAMDLSKLDPFDATYVAGEAASYAYAPYSRNYAGSAIRTKQGTVHQGRYAETCSSLAGVSAVEAACVHLILSGRTFEDIAEIVLVEARGTVTQFSSTHKLAKAMNDTPFRFVMLN